MAYETINFTPPAGVREEAARGLAWREEYGRGGTAIGVARARDLSNGKNISPDTAKRMKAYFDRHEIDKEGQGWSPDQEGWPSAGRVAWALWGGDPGQAWSNKLVRQMDAEDGNRSVAMQPERRFLAQAGDVDIELRVETRDDGRPMIVGMAPPWNRWSVDLGGFKERFMPGAFKKYLERSPNDPRGKADVVAKYNHDDSAVLGRTTNGTLELQETEKGLVFRATPPDGTPTTAEVIPLIRGGYVYGSSFAFSLPDARGEQWDEDPAGNVTRTITEAAIYDVSPVTHAAYPNSTVGLRSLSAWREARGLVHHRAEGRGLLISLDYDRTWTAAPGLWRSFVSMATERGNRVVCISRRDDTDENREEIRSAFVDLDVSDVVLCGPGTQKRSAAAAAGLDIDIWIDDYPEGISDQQMLSPRSRGVMFSTLAGARAAAAAASARMRIVTG